MGWEAGNRFVITCLKMNRDINTENREEIEKQRPGDQRGLIKGREVQTVSLTSIEPAVGNRQFESRGTRAGALERVRVGGANGSLAVIRQGG